MAIEWPLVLFSLLAGAGGCMFAYVGLSEFTGVTKEQRFKLTITALVITIVGGFCSVAHLAAPQNVMAAVWNLGSFSGISVELMLIGVACIVMFAYLVVLKRGANDTALKVLGALGIVAGLALGFFTGHGYVIEAQAAWNTEVLPFAYLGTSLAMGAFAYLVAAVAFKADAADVEKVGVPVCVGALIGALTSIAYVVAVGFDHAAEAGIVLWGGIIVCGVVITAICGVLAALKKNIGGAYGVPVVGLLATLVGGLALRCFMWVMGGGFLSLFAVASTSRVVFFG